MIEYVVLWCGVFLGVLGVGWCKRWRFVEIIGFVEMVIDWCDVELIVKWMFFGVGGFLLEIFE